MTGEIRRIWSSTTTTSTSAKTIVALLGTPEHARITLPLAKMTWMRDSAVYLPPYHGELALLPEATTRFSLCFGARGHGFPWMQDPHYARPVRAF